MAGEGEDLPSGTVTFLLTDVVGSSRLWEQRPGEAGGLVARSRELIEQSTVASGGVCPIEQGEGDSTVSAFARASDAAVAAAAAQQALAAEAWPDAGGVGVRMALHTGEAEPAADGTYAGPVLNRCARLRAVAHQGQVLVSGPAADLLAEGLDDGLGLTELGVHRLRDLSRPEHVFQLVGPALAREFPALRSLDATPNNLPVQLSTFVGREDEIAQGSTLLGETRLLTLTGAGGCGKTRLSQRIAAETVDSFPGGVWWVELAPVAHPDRLGDAVVSALGLRVLFGRSAIDVVADYLGSDVALVVLDNCEHLIATAAELTDQLLRQCPGVRVLATSREPLSIEGEVSWRVPSLPVPPPVGADTEPEVVAAYDAVRLFIDRAVAARPTFRVDNDTAPAVAAICSRLDGIPLAIELAAARVRTLSPDRIATELDDRFRLLAGGSRTALPRQQTLHASVDWSHELLDPDERAVFRRLGVFAGGFTLDAAETVTAAAPVDAYAVMDVLGRLVDKSLVQVDDTGRYELLETIRAYTSDRLTEAGETNPTRDHHLAWVVAMAEAAAEKILNGDGPTLDRVDLDHGNIRAAISWALDSDQIDPALRLVAACGPLWGQRGHYEDGNTLATTVLDRAVLEDADIARRAQARIGHATLAWTSLDLISAREIGHTAIEEATAAGDPRLLGNALVIAGLGEVDLGTATLEEGERLTAQHGDAYYHAAALLGLGWWWQKTGHHHQAADCHRRQREEGAAIGSKVLQAWAACGLGHASLIAGDSEAGRRHLQESLLLAREHCDPQNELTLAGGYCLYLGYAGHVEEVTGAVTALTSRRVERGPVASLMLTSMAAVGRSHADPAAAFRDLADTNPTFAAVGLSAEAGLLSYIAARTALDLGDPQAALEQCPIRRELERFPGIHADLTVMAAMAGRDLGHESAENDAHEALATFLELDYVRGVPAVLTVLAGLALDAESPGEATRLLAAADALHTRIDHLRSPAAQQRFDTDVDHARDLLGDEFEQIWAEGAALDWRDAAAYARRARGERKRPSFGWDSLTPTERHCAELAAEGLSNPEIAERMFIGRGTVKTHLARTFTKLDVRNRTELAAVVLERTNVVVPLDE